MINGILDFFLAGAAAVGGGGNGADVTGVCTAGAVKGADVCCAEVGGGGGGETGGGGGGGGDMSAVSGPRVGVPVGPVLRGSATVAG